jgi:hypothetical protein
MPVLLGNTQAGGIMSGWDQEQEYQAGVRDERERIIKLLEKQLAEQKVGMFYGDAIRASILIIEEDK